MKLLFLLFLHLQQPADTTLARTYFDDASEMMRNGRYTEAVTKLELAAPIYKKASAWEQYVHTTNMMAQGYGRVGSRDKAISLGQMALELSEEYLPNTEQEMLAHKNLGILFEIYGHYDKAFEHTNQYLGLSLSLFGESHENTGNAYNNLGLLHRKMGQFNKAIANIQIAIDIKSVALGKDHPNLAISYHNFGFLHVDKGDIEKGLGYLEKALKIRSPHLPPNHPYIASDYHAIGLANENLGNYSLAKEYYMKSLAMQQSLFGNDHGDILANLFQLGRLFGKIKEFNLAVDYLSQSASMAQRIYGQQHPAVASCWDMLGRTYLKMGAIEASEQYLFQALELREKVFGSQSYQIGSSYLSLGRLERQKGSNVSASTNFQVAHDIFGKLNETSRVIECLNELASVAANDSITVKLYQKSLAANLVHFKDTTGYNNPQLSDPIDKYHLLTALYGKGVALFSLFERSKETDLLEEAFVSFQTADTLVGQIRNSHMSQEDKVLLGEKAVELYEKAIETSLQLYDIKKDRYYLEAAFQLLERSKAQVLTSSFNEAKARKFGDVPDSLLAKEKQIKIDLSYFQSQPRDENGRFSENVSKSIFQLKREQQQLINKFENNYPKYARLKYANVLAPLNIVQNSLSFNSTILEYFQGTEIIYAFAISSENVHVVRIPISLQLEEHVGNMHKGIINRDKELYAASAHWLYKALVAPVKNHLNTPRLTIIPDGVVWNVNFDLLLSRLPSNNDYTLWDYLIKEFAIGYAYHANTLFDVWKDTQNSSELLAFSYSEDNWSPGDQIALATLRDSQLKEIPGTSLEIKSISNIWDGSYYYGQSASENNFKSKSGSYSIIHLALHGIVDNEDPNNSRLHFAQKNDSLDDATLYTHELYNLDLNADLVVLSACNSGTGKTYKGEGVMSLGRAFAFSGTKSILLTQWEISDAVSPQIMKNFYSDLKNGHPKDVALRNAKLKFLSSTDNLTSSPFYWGSFFLLGDSGALVASAWSGQNIAYLLIILVVIALVVYFRKSLFVAV